MSDTLLPSQVSGNVGPFDQFASAAASLVSRAPFFAACLLLVIIWAPSYFIFQDVDTWQLVINTATTIVTFVLVALLQNSQRRSDQAIQHKLNAIAQALSDFMCHVDAEELREDVDQLHAAVGLERRETSSKR